MTLPLSGDGGRWCAQHVADALNAQTEREAAEKPVGAPVYSDKDGEVVVVKNKDGRLIATRDLRAGEPVFMTFPPPPKPAERVRCGKCGHYLPYIPNNAAGICKRFPTPLEKNVDDWCGEGRRKE